MKIKLTIGAFVPVHPGTKDEEWIGPIPGTVKEMVLDTDNGLGQMIWHGYLQIKSGTMFGPFPLKQIPETLQGTIPWEKVRAGIPQKFKEAFNGFHLFMGGLGRDNFLRAWKAVEIAEQNPHTLWQIDALAKARDGRAFIPNPVTAGLCFGGHDPKENGYDFTPDELHTNH